MKKPSSGSKRPAKKGAAKKAASKAAHSQKAGAVIGRQRFAKISAVEGIVMKEGMNARTVEFERRGTSAEERRATIIRAYRKG